MEKYYLASVNFEILKTTLLWHDFGLPVLEWDGGVISRRQVL